MTNRADAKQLRTIEDLKTDALFAAAEKGESLLGVNKNGQSGFSLAMLTEHVRSTVERLDQKFERDLAVNLPTDPDTRHDMWFDAGYELTILTNPADTRRDELVERAGRQILADAGIELADLETHAQFDEVVRRGLIELSRRRLDRYDDRYDRSNHDNLFDPTRLPVLSFGELAETYLAQKGEDYALNQVSTKRLDKVKASVATLREIIGNATHVQMVDDDIVQNVRSVIARIPANRLRFYPTLTLDQAIEQGVKDGKRTLATPTQGQYLAILCEMLKLAVRKKILSTNPAADIRPLKKDTLSADQKRLPWTAEQLTSFFTGGFYRACAPGVVKPYAKPDREWRFWLPLIELLPVPWTPS